ncbi:hypothetical protein E4U36_000121 [Claviceps purpurea]|nr:hypothetical protein E4U36_000121 [Claviceps purpurea]
MIQAPSLPSPPYCAPHVHALPVFRRNVRHIGFRDSLDQQVWYQSLEEAKPRHRPSRTGGRGDVRHSCLSDQISHPLINSRHCIPFASLASKLPCS